MYKINANELLETEGQHLLTCLFTFRQIQREWSSCFMFMVKKQLILAIGFSCWEILLQQGITVFLE